MTIPLEKAGCPDLQTLIERAGRRYAASIGEDYVEDPFKRPPHQGGYPHVTVEEWAEYDRQMAEWQAQRRTGSQGSGESTASERAAADPERLCICGLPGVVSRPRKGGKSGGPIWRCEQHRNLWPEYTEDIPLRGAAR